jgi:hypothetical protein
MWVSATTAITASDYAVIEAGGRGVPGLHREDGRTLSSNPTETGIQDGAPGPVQGYAPPQERPPLLSYAVLMSIFNALFAGALLTARRQGRQLPESVRVVDVVSIGIASHKLSRLISKDKVTSPLRAPFTELEGKGGPGELEESSRGRGARKAIGELLICPYCLGLWVVASFAVGLLFAPRLTRFVVAIFSALTISDFLQIAYKAAEEKGLG